MEFRPATAAERDPVSELLLSKAWQDGYVDVGETWVAVDAGSVVGTARLIDAGDGAWYVADVIVRENRRGSGIGTRMMAAAMASRPDGTFYLVCHPEPVAFYGRLGFVDVPKSSWPEGVIAVSRAEDDYDTDHEELHHYMQRD